MWKVSLALLGCGMTCGITYGAITAVDTYREMHIPRFYDRSSTRQIMKFKDIALYQKEHEKYIEIVQSIGDVSRMQNPSANKVNNSLHALLQSPFYDARHSTMIMRVKASLHTGSLPANALNGAPCLQKNNLGCTTQELLMDLYKELQ